MRRQLPKHVQKIYKYAVNSAGIRYAGREDCKTGAHKVAWSAIKRLYRREEDWQVKKWPGYWLIPAVSLADVVAELLAFLIHAHQVAMCNAKQCAHYFVYKARMLFQQ